MIGHGRHEDLLASSPRYAALLTAYEEAARAVDALPTDVPPGSDRSDAGPPDTRLADQRRPDERRSDDGRTGGDRPGRVPPDGERSDDALSAEVAS